MDTSKDIRERLEKILIGDTPRNIRLHFLGMGRSISDADEFVKQTIDAQIQVFKEYIEAQQAYSVWPTTDPKDLKYLDKAQVLECLEKEVI